MVLRNLNPSFYLTLDLGNEVGAKKPTESTPISLLPYDTWLDPSLHSFWPQKLTQRPKTHWFDTHNTFLPYNQSPLFFEPRNELGAQNPT